MSPRTDPKKQKATKSKKAKSKEITLYVVYTTIILQTILSITTTMSSYNKRYNTRSSDTTTSSGTSKRAKKTETGGADNNPEPNDTKPTARKQPSKVALKGSGSGKSTESALKKKEKMEEMTKQLKKEQKELEKKLRYHKKALKVILEKSGKTGKTGKTDNNIPVHTILQGAYEELGMEKKGMSYDTTAIKQNSNILLPGSANAMAQQTSPMDAKQVSRCEYRLRTHPSRMDGGKMGFTFGKKTTTNTKNQTVNLNASNANRVGYEYSEKHDYGLGKHNREKALDLEPQMIELCNNHEWIASIPESRNRNTLVIAETPDEDE